MTTISIHTPAFVRVPRGALWAAEAFRRLLGAFAPEPLVEAPTLRSRAAEADDVRELACSVAKTDPGFAADLYAAANRHEGRRD